MVYTKHLHVCVCQETCGGSDAINIFTASCPTAPASNACTNPFPPSPGPNPAPTKPQYHGCTGPNASNWAYCDVSKTNSERVDAMLALLDPNPNPNPNPKPSPKP